MELAEGDLLKCRLPFDFRMDVHPALRSNPRVAVLRTDESGGHDSDLHGGAAHFTRPSWPP